MTRTSSTANLRPFPFFVTIMAWSSSLTKMQCERTSPSSRKRALTPFFLAFTKALSGTRFTVPILVHMRMHLSSLNSVKSITVVMDSFSSSLGRTAFMLVPLPTFWPSGISHVSRTKALPWLVTNIIWSCVFAVKRYSTKSSSLSVAPLTPVPPLPWLLYSCAETRFTKPLWVATTTHSSFFMKSLSTIPVISRSSM